MSRITNKVIGLAAGACMALVAVVSVAATEAPTYGDDQVCTYADGTLAHLDNDEAQPDGVTCHAPKALWEVALTGW